MKSSGDMKIDDTDNYYYEEVVQNLPNPHNSSPLVVGDQSMSPEKQILLGPSVMMSDTALLPPIKGLKAYQGRIGVGGNDSSLRNIF